MPHKDNFEPCVYKCMFIGNSPGQKPYRVYNIVTCKIHISSDVVFYENHFLYHKTMTSDTLVPLRMIPASNDIRSKDVSHSPVTTLDFSPVTGYSNSPPTDFIT